MRRKFWQFVHDCLEAAWHWVYINKLAEPLPTSPTVSYNITYVCGKTGFVSFPSPTIAEWKEEPNA